MKPLSKVFKVLKGLVALGIAVSLTGCSSAGRSLFGAPDPFRAKSLASVTTGNRVTPLVDGDEVYPAIEKLIDSAQHSVQLQVYLFGGEVGKRIADRLIKKQKAGLELQVVIDPALGSAGPSREQMVPLVRYLESQGVTVRRYPVASLPKGKSWFAGSRRIDHAKFVIADGKRAIMGGMNYYDDADKAHDYMIKIEGPAAARLGEIAQRDWVDAGGKATLAFQASPVGNATVEFGDNGIQERTIESLLLDSIRNAKQRVWVEMLLLDHDAILDALADAKRRGVDVRVVLDATAVKETIGSLGKKLPLEGVMNYSAAKDLLDAGIPVHWYKPSNRFHYLHAKVSLVDDRVLVGSSNYTFQALGLNREILARVDDPLTVAQMERVFEEDWRSQSTPITGMTRLERAIAALSGKIKKMLYKVEEREDETVVSTEVVSVPAFELGQ